MKLIGLSVECHKQSSFSFSVTISQLTFSFSSSLKVWVFVETESKSRPMVGKCCVSTAGHWLPCRALDGNEDVSSKQLFA